MKKAFKKSKELCSQLDNMSDDELTEYKAIYDLLEDGFGEITLPKMIALELFSLKTKHQFQIDGLKRVNTQIARNLDLEEIANRQRLINEYVGIHL
ncbi:hypothetical protein FHQ28_05615 [Pasteurellaceae bacterium USgator11]|nr:hypothetical protein FHQ20_07875 [Pasteurellaceae bacterium USgator41]TNG96474.1 hypothetical protein FHQ19_02050 [Pasteurellaceae bacterium UScroc12]TNH00444.1 hypothetical protein FHQ24_03575 [Pasteurellaceae bacterium UScroc31]TNH01725.1 hypothetical protein FHQ28_05615 [Pasteurellaceae bacterium USgator11]